MKLWLKNHIYAPVLVLVFALAVLAVGYYETQTRGTPRSARIEAGDVACAETCWVYLYEPEHDGENFAAAPETFVSMQYDDEQFPLVLEAAELVSGARPLRHTKTGLRYFAGMRYYRLVTRGRNTKGETVELTLYLREDQLSQERALLPAYRMETDGSGTVTESWRRTYYFTLPREDYARLFEICEQLTAELPDVQSTLSRW